MRKLFLIVPAIVLAPFIVLPYSAMASGKATFHWVDNTERGTADLMLGNQPVLRYMYGYDNSTPKRAKETYKVFHHVFGPGSEDIITKGAGGLYTHHRGLYVGWRKTGFEGQSLDFWHCNRGETQRHVRFIETSGNDKQGRMIAEIHWNDPGGKPVITETRSVTVTAQAGRNSTSTAWQIDWQTRLKSNRGTITLEGDRQHAGFQFRAAQQVADTKGARYIRPHNFPQQTEAFQVDDKGTPPRHINLGWLAMTFEKEGRRYTIEYFEKPGHPKPSLYSERPYGRFGAYFKTMLTPEKPLTMTYRIRVSSGSVPKQADIQARYDAYVAEQSKPQ